MTGVETNSNPILVLNAVDDAPQLQKAAANCSSLPGHVFKHYNALHSSINRRL